MQQGFRSVIFAVRDVGKLNRPALHKAAALAASRGASLELFHAITEPVLIETGRRRGADPAREIEERLCARLERAADALKRPGLTVNVEVNWDYPPHEAVVRRARKIRADLVVGESRRHRAAARLFLSNTDWELIRHCESPLLLVKTPRAYHRPTVIAAVDPFHTRDKPAILDHALMAAGQRVARAFNGRLYAFHAYLPLGDTWIPASAIVKYRRRMAQGLRDLCKRHALPSSRQVLREGLVADELSRLVRKSRAQLVVLGAISRSGLSRLFIGNTAERVIDEMPCDVLIVKPPQFKSRLPRRGRRAPVFIGPVPY